MLSSCLPFLCLILTAPVLFKAAGFCGDCFSEVQEADVGHMVNQC